jgi:hypothetical protein
MHETRKPKRSPPLGDKAKRKKKILVARPKMVKETLRQG